MCTVLAPRLGERLEFDIARVATEEREVVADDGEFGWVEGQSAFIGETSQGLVTPVVDRDDGRSLPGVGGQVWVIVSS